MVSFIHQSSSWSRLEISAEAAKKLLTVHNVSPILLDAMYSFGAKVTGDDDPYFNLCYCRRSNDSSAEVHGPYYGSSAALPLRLLSCLCLTEICYILRSYETHGRTNLSNPYSLRQMAVYHKYYCNSQRSIWIIIQPFRGCKAALSRKFPRSTTLSSALSLHSCLIGPLLPNWRWYLNYNRRLITELVSRFEDEVNSRVPI